MEVDDVFGYDWGAQTASLSRAAAPPDGLSGEQIRCMSGAAPV
jgi:hypothetical protein